MNFFLSVYNDYITLTPSLYLLLNIGYTGAQGSVDPQSLLALMHSLGLNVKTSFMPPGPFCFIEFHSVTESEAAFSIIHSQTSIKCRYVHAIPDEYSRNVLNLKDITDNIPGLHYFPDFLSDKEEMELLTELLGVEDWITLGHRRVKHYGYSYDYKNEGSRKVEEFPHWICPVLRRIYNVWPHTEINQLTINCYEPGEGIGPHLDSEKLFGRDAIIVVSITSGIVMDFINGNVRKLVDVGRRSLLIMSNEARLEWKHGIRNRKMDYVNGDLRKRGVRISFTFRRVYPVEKSRLLD